MFHTLNNSSTATRREKRSTVESRHASDVCIHCFVAIFLILQIFLAFLFLFVVSLSVYVHTLYFHEIAFDRYSSWLNWILFYFAHYFYVVALTAAGGVTWFFSFFSSLIYASNKFVAFISFLNIIFNIFLPRFFFIFFSNSVIVCSEQRSDICAFFSLPIHFRTL